ncbi:disease resistance protein RPP13-like [Apium graveolens]|uniref:disease resistance protein RPP13-like n=1 Tax=Apium graveolens TaxID=4045 RepID=UPI003D7BA051
MVDATVSFAIEKLNDFISQEINTRRGVEDGIRWLKDELDYLQSFVSDAETKQGMDQRISKWISSVRDVANEAVIILERINVLHEEHAAPKHGVLDHLHSFIGLCKREAKLYQIGKEIKSLKERIIEIKKRREEYGIAIIFATSKVLQKKRTLLRATSFENQVDVVGFEDDVNTLLAQLVSEDPSLSLISIHGMGGLGKTTLASKLYHSSELSHFESRAWVCVSQDYNINDLLKTIIKSFMGHESGHELDLLKMDKVDLLQHLRKLLLGRHRYLVVIDDIWDVEAWEKIKKAFPDKMNGSRVIITTRNKKVAQRVDDKCFVHKLRFLNENESWQLFCKRAKPTSNLEKIGKEMVDKCRGLPLAIVVLSGLLLHKKSYEAWSKVKDRIWGQLTDNSVEIQEILSLSYADLSFQMRQCFLYLARFPEDQTFEVHNLKLLWIAEEFISQADEKDGVVMEDVADKYLNELINRNLIQISTLLWNGQVLECRVHDLVRDLAIQKATEHKLLGIFDSSKQHPSSIRLLQQPRHAIYNGIGKYFELLGPSSYVLKLRSLAVINETGRCIKVKEIKMMYTRFKYLKVLDLISVNSDGIPAEIGDLVLLKYLGLMGSHIISKPLAIPPTIGKLKRLQTLHGWSDYQFPKEICELKELRHLIFPYFSKRLAKGSLKIGSHQTKLQTLDSIWYEDWIQIYTINLTNLRSLAIRDSSYNAHEYTLDSIANLTSLQTLILEFRTHVIPTSKPLSSCKRLKSVKLSGIYREEYGMQS